MRESLLLIGHSLALLALFSAIGSGPVILLIRDRGARLVIAPVLGFALTASVQTTIGLALPLGQSTWTVIVPLAALSALLSIAAARRHPSASADRSFSVPIALSAAAIVLALFPPLSHGTQGPFALNVYDAWGYAATSSFLEHHKIGEKLSPEVAEKDLVTSNGSNGASGNARIGVDAVNASAAALFRVDTGATLAPLLAVLFGLLPAIIWLLVNNLGGSARAAAIGAGFGLTPAMLSLVEDTALGNLAGEVLFAPILLFMARAVRGSKANAVLSGALLGGLLAVYPEYLPPLMIVAGIGGAIAIVELIRRKALREWIVSGAATLGVIAATAIAVAPNAALRAFRYLSERTGDGPWAQDLPLRWIDEQNIGAWSFGVLHLYEMGGFSTLSPLRQAFAILFPIVLAAVVIIGIVARPRLLLVFVGAPIVVAGALGLYAFESFQNGRCEYCLWKSLTIILPFLSVGLAFGFERLWIGSRRSGSNMFDLRRTATLAVAVVAFVALGYSDFRLVRTTRSEGAFCPSQLRDLGERLDRLPPESSVMIEGAGSMRKPTFMLNSIYFTTRGENRRILFDAENPTIAYLATIEAAPLYYSPDYEYVLTPFEDVQSQRIQMERFGSIALERRAPVDIIVSHPDLAVDASGARIPWVSKPFTLRIASDKEMDAALTLGLTRPSGNRSTLVLTLGDQRLESVSPAPNAICVNLHLASGETRISITPQIDSTFPPSPTLRKDLGLKSIRVKPGACAVSAS